MGLNNATVSGQLATLLQQLGSHEPFHLASETWPGLSKLPLFPRQMMMAKLRFNLTQRTVLPLAHTAHSTAISPCQLCLISWGTRVHHVSVPQLQVTQPMSSSVSIRGSRHTEKPLSLHKEQGHPFLPLGSNHSTKEHGNFLVR